MSKVLYLWEQVSGVNPDTNEPVVKVPVSVRLTSREGFYLSVLADLCGKSKTGLAQDLLGAAIADCVDVAAEGAEGYRFSDNEYAEYLHVLGITGVQEESE